MPFSSLHHFQKTARSEANVASRDYPELEEILVDRPPPNSHEARVDGLCALCNQEPATQEISGTTVGERCAEHLMGVPGAGTPYPEFGQSVYGSQHTAGFIMDWLDRRLAPLAPDIGSRWSFDWCRYRKNSHCYYPSQLDAQATQLAGYSVWVPQDRGSCPRYTWEAQEACPIGAPGPNSGAANAQPDATVSWAQGGQRGGIIDAQSRYSSLDQKDPSFHWHFLASWADVRAKAKRLRKEGKVKITGAPNEKNPYITAEVQGDNNTYQTTILRTIGGKSVAGWECTCAWAHYAWGRSGRWKKFEGRQCSHALATIYQAQADEMFGGKVKEIERRPVDWVTKPYHYDQDPQTEEKRKRYLGEPWRLDQSRRGSLHQETSFSEERPVAMEVEARLEAGEHPNVVLGYLREIGAPWPEYILTEALHKPFVARDPANELHRIVHLDGEHAVTDAGERIPVEHLTHPEFDWHSGLQPPEQPEQLQTNSMLHWAGSVTPLNAAQPDEPEPIEPVPPLDPWYDPDPEEPDPDVYPEENEEYHRQKKKIQSSSMLVWARRPIKPVELIHPGNAPGGVANMQATHFPDLAEGDQDQIRSHVEANSPNKSKPLNERQLIDNIKGHFHDAITRHEVEGKASSNYSGKQAKGPVEEGADWYPQAHRDTKKWAKQYGMSHESMIGTTAALSPRSDWANNIETAHYTARHLGKNTNESFNVPHEQAWVNRDGGRQDLTHLVGKRFHDLSDEEAADALVAKSRHEGLRSHIAEPAASTGEKPKTTWSTSPNIVKAVKIARGADANDVLGGHKVRSFRNNLGDPDNVHGNDDVTMDSHAVSAACNHKYTGKGPSGAAFKKIFDTSGKGAAGREASKNVHGTYSYFAHAYRQAHAELRDEGHVDENFHPSDLQATVWNEWRTKNKRKRADKPTSGEGQPYNEYNKAAMLVWAGVQDSGMSEDVDPGTDDDMDQASTVQKAYNDQAEAAQDDWYFNQPNDQKPFADNSANVPTYMSALPHGAMLVWGAEAAEETLHDEPEGALPSTDGGAPSEDWQAQHSTTAADPISAGPAGFGSPLDPGYAHEDLGYPDADEAVLRPSGGPGAGSFMNDLENKFNTLDATGSLDPGADSRAWLLSGGSPRNAGGDQGIRDSDIAAMARQFLNTGELPEGSGPQVKVAAKVFSPAEQQELITEGSDGTRASNLDRLQLEGTHYQTGDDEDDLDGLFDG
jgi:hypothetical protein